MRRVLKLIKYSIVLLLLAAVVGLFLPRTYSVERSVLISDHPIKVFIHVGDLENWPTWNPWQQGKKDYVVSLGSTTNGVGASQIWTSRHGGGEVTFTKTVPLQGVEYDYRFHGDWETKASIRFSVGNNGTLVTWTLRGECPTPIVGGYLAKMMDSMVGGMLDYGLGLLKKVVESDQRQLISD